MQVYAFSLSCKVKEHRNKSISMSVDKIVSEKDGEK